MKVPVSSTVFASGLSTSVLRKSPRELQDRLITYLDNALETGNFEDMEFTTHDNIDTIFGFSIKVEGRWFKLTIRRKEETGEWCA